MKILIALITTLFFALAVHAQKQAEVIVPSTFLRAAPDASAEKTGTLEQGAKVIFEKNRETNGWFYVSAANGTTKGWIRKDTIKRIADAPPKPSAVPEKIPSIAVESGERPKNPPNVTSPTESDSAKKNPSNAAADSPAANDSPPISSPNPPPAAAAPAAPNPANVPAEDDEVIRVETEEVSLKVRVLGANNRTVKNLDSAQFKVYEDGVEQPIVSVTTAQIPVISALVIDNSRSLRAQLAEIVEAGKTIVAANLPQDESAVVRFVSRDKIEVVRDFTPNINAIDNALDNLFVEGGQTAIIDAVYDTAQKVDDYQFSRKKEDVKTRALILVSDGDDRSSRHSEQELFDLLRGSQVQIYTVGFTGDVNSVADANGVNRREKAQSLLTRLAEETGGKAYFPTSVNDLSGIAADISREIRTQYLISYAPIGESRAGNFRKILVTVADGANSEKRTVIARPGRTVAPK